MLWNGTFVCDAFIVKSNSFDNWTKIKQLIHAPKWGEVCPEQERTLYYSILVEPDFRPFGGFFQLPRYYIHKVIDKWNNKHGFQESNTINMDFSM